jgi:hypothetical protein
MEGVRGDDRIARIQAPLREALANWRQYKPITPVGQHEEASLAAGSISATVTPPYDFEWVQQKGDGPVEVKGVAQKQNGVLSCDVHCPYGGDASDGKAWAAVGVYFKPAFDGVVTLTMTTMAILSYWYTVVANADAHTAAKVGLRVYQFVNGKLNPQGYIKQHSTILWDVPSHADPFESGGEGPHSEAYTAPISLQFNASREASYNLWVYFKTGASADGGATLNLGEARAEINSIVTSISWTLSS